MTKITAKVRIQTDDLLKIKMAYIKYVSNGYEQRELYGLNFSIVDARNEVASIVATRKEKGISETSPLDQFYEYDKSLVLFVISVQSFSMLRECLPGMAEGVARLFSKICSVPCAVYIEERPMSVFANGIKIAQVDGSYELYDKLYLLE